MEIVTTRFGAIEVGAERLLTFPSGLLGFPDQRRFALVPNGDGGAFQWLQSADEPELAFVVCDPTLFFRDYDAPVREETAAELGVAEGGRTRTLVICNKVGEWLTGNLLGPIVVNPANRTAAQVVLTEKRWTTRQPLVRLTPTSLSEPVRRSA